MNAQIRYLLPYFLTHRVKFFLPFALAFISVGLDHLSPWMLKLLLDALHTPKQISHLYSQLAIIAIAVVFSGILGYIQRAILADFSRNVEASIRTSLYSRLIAQPKLFFQKTPTGDLLQNLVQDLDKMQELCGPAMLHLFRTVLTLLTSTVLLYLLSPSMAVLGFLFFTFLAIASLKLMRMVYSGHRQIQKSQGELGGFLRDFLHGIPVAKASGCTDFFSSKLEAQSSKVMNGSLSIAKISATIWPAITLLCGLGIAVSMAWGAHLVAIGAMGAGSLAAAVLYLVRAQYPLVGLGIMAAVIQRGRASLDRVMDLDSKLQMNAFGSPSDMQPHFTSLVLQNLDFTYPDQSNPVLGQISLDLRVGSMVGIVGPTGSGKTTLAKILAGVIPPPPRMCFLNDRDLADLHTNENHGSWRLNIAYAPQDGFLFSWTIAENIALSATTASLEAILEVSSQAGLTPDIPQFPDGLDSVLGEKGVNLSGGQRQRVGLARAFLSQSPVLILDDVLSAVDPRTEQRIVGTLDEYRSNHAILLVTHRYVALQNCSEILYLEEGRIVERGTHAELVELGGRYAMNWKIQSCVPGGVDA